MQGLNLTARAAADTVGIMQKGGLKFLYPEAWKILDAQLAKHAFIAGDNLTMADIPFCYIVNRWYRLPLEHDGLSNVKAWFDRLCERPAFRRNVYEVG